MQQNGIISASVIKKEKQFKKVTEEFKVILSTDKEEYLVDWGGQKNYFKKYLFSLYFD